MLPSLPFVCLLAIFFDEEVVLLCGHYTAASLFIRKYPLSISTFLVRRTSTDKFGESKRRSARSADILPRMSLRGLLLSRSCFYEIIAEPKFTPRNVHFYKSYVTTSLRENMFSLEGIEVNKVHA